MPSRSQDEFTSSNEQREDRNNQQRDLDRRRARTEFTRLDYDRRNPTRGSRSLEVALDDPRRWANNGLIDLTRGEAPHSFAVRNFHNALGAVRHRFMEHLLAAHHDCRQATANSHLHAGT